MLLTEQQTEESEALVVTTGTIEELQRILATQARRDVSHDEASEVGDALVEFYQTLAEEEYDESTE